MTLGTTGMHGGTTVAGMTGPEQKSALSLGPVPDTATTNIVAGCQKAVGNRLYGAAALAAAAATLGIPDIPGHALRRILTVSVERPWC